MAIHAYPVNDLQEHSDESTCQCNPNVTIQHGEMVVCHNFFDGGEIIGEVNEILKNETEKDRAD